MLTENFKRLELKQLISILGQLPISPPYLLDSINERYTFLKFKESSAILELWLRKLILFESAFSSSNEEYFVFFKPLAEFYRALLDLCLSLQMKNPINFSDPYMAWFLAITSKVQENLDCSLLVSDSLPLSKEQRVREGRQLIKNFEELSVTGNGELNIQMIILLEAQEIAKGDDIFYKSSFKPFLTMWRKYLRVMERCEKLEIFQITLDGGVYISKKGRKAGYGTLSEREIISQCNGIVTKMGLSSAK